MRGKSAEEFAAVRVFWSEAQRTGRLMLARRFHEDIRIGEREDGACRGFQVGDAEAVEALSVPFTHQGDWLMLESSLLSKG